MHESPKALEKICLKAAEAGAKKAATYFNKTLQVKYKGSEKHAGTIVTQADIAAEKEVMQIISKHYPTHTIIAEEHGGIQQEGYNWFIDPVDGTGNFSRGLLIWGTLVGVALNSKPIAGAMVFPELRRKYYASKGNGAFADGKRIKVSNKTLSEGLVFTPSLHRQTDRKLGLAIAEHFAGTIGGLRMIGCTGYEGALIAEGKAELKLKMKTTAWDSCAAAILVTEAGGKYCTFQGKNWTTKDTTAIGANQKAFKQAFFTLKTLL